MAEFADIDLSRKIKLSADSASVVRPSEADIVHLGLCANLDVSERQRATGETTVARCVCRARHATDYPSGGVTVSLHLPRNHSSRPRIRAEHILLCHTHALG